MARFLNKRILKYTFILLTFYLIDYFGILVHLFEISYERYFSYPYHQQITNYAHQQRFKLKVFKQPCNYHNYTFIINPFAEKCNQGDDTLLTILIKSSLKNKKHRDVIRRTWGFEQRFSDIGIKRVFVLGTNNQNEDLLESIRLESKQYGDIVQANFIDSYYNNTIKTMIGMRWIVESCSKSSYYMFVDDDYYVSIKNVLQYLGNPTCYPEVITNDPTELAKIRKDGSKTKLFAGNVLYTSPLRHKASKWYVSLEEYPFDMWPPYITAGAYILSNEAAIELYYFSLYTRHFRFDDIYLGIVSLRAEIPLTNCDMFYFDKPRYRGPESYKTVVASHGYDDVAELEHVWNECRSAGFA